MARNMKRRVKATNALPRDIFLDRFIKEDLSNVLDGHVIQFETFSSLAPQDFEACVNLVETTSKPAYVQSRDGWSRKGKEEEMADPDMRFLLVKPRGSALKAEGELAKNFEPMHGSEAELTGFLSFMVTIEDEMEVVYCYEVHVHDWARGSGIGSRLMNILASIGSAVGVEKAMLTVFTSNVAGIRLYERLGFLWYAEEPLPPRRRLRGRLTPKPKPSYIILAKELSPPPSEIEFW